ncbi:hypothetical protein WR25_24357 [Diploscapter pachys]|uniref:Miro domain-containing protein n=1 Tax=Diploscapter pachys TaxID=2018661 RepID=A0A2A2JA84_9BILA|nr:hypothetical protein WR25_24357 [Diploscapter pachys]
MSSIKKKKGPLRLISKEASILADGQSAPCSPAVKKVQFALELAERKTYRLVIVGSARTGKSAILSRFLEKGFEDRYIPTIENFYRKLYKIKGDLYQLDIIDCSGNDPFPAARKLSYISGDMFLIVSSVEQAESIYHMLEIRQQIEDCKASRGVTSTTPEVPCVFVLSKTDLPEYRWMVTQEEIQRKVEEEAGTSENLIFCSALKDTNIDKVGK